MMIDILILIITTSLVCVGFWVATDFDGADTFDTVSHKRQRRFFKPGASDRMILWWVRYYGGPWLGQFWSKPLYKCLPCMGSVHSILPTLLFCQYYDTSFWVLWPLVALGVSGLNYLISKYI